MKNFKIGDTIYEDFEGNNSIPPQIFELKITRIDENGVYILDQEYYINEELSYPFREFGKMWFDNIADLFKYRTNT